VLEIRTGLSGRKALFVCGRSILKRKTAASYILNADGGIPLRASFPSGV
jgi:hypothetical protein